MINFLIIDSIKICLSIQAAIKNMSFLNLSDISIEFNESAEISWHNAFKNPYKYDAVMLDIGRNAEEISSAVEKAKILYKANNPMHIIFLTDFALIPMEVWQIPHIHILKKPVIYEEACRVIKHINAELSDQQSRFSNKVIAKHGKIVHMIPESSILYAKKSRKGITLITERQEICDYTKIDEFIKNAGKIFCRCHSSYVVNFRHVTLVQKDNLALDNGENISISRPYKKIVQDFINGLSIENQQNQAINTAFT